jgi:hypothetical protein
MVGEYTDLTLTFKVDRLAAMQGCVQQIKDVMSEDYVLGLWEDSLLEDLCWETISVGKDDRRPPELFGLPTWSWASAGGHAAYEETTPGTVFKGHASVALSPVNNLAGDDHSSQHRLIVTGPFIPARLSFKKNDREWLRKGCVVLNIDGIFVTGCHTSSTSLPQWCVRLDSWMEAEDWDNHSQVYDIGIMWLAQRWIPDRANGTQDISVVLWRYGKTIPGSGKRREAMAGIPIYQRIGMLHSRSSSELRGTRSSMSGKKKDDSQKFDDNAGMLYVPEDTLDDGEFLSAVVENDEKRDDVSLESIDMSEDSYRSNGVDQPRVDWNKAETVTIALE